MTDRGRVRKCSHQQFKIKSKNNKVKKKNNEVSLLFCWSFGVFVLASFGLASFLMFSAGHFSSFSAEEAWSKDNNSTNLLSVEITELEPIEKNDDSDLIAQNPNSHILEEFGPLPKYLSDYESIILNEQDNGTNIPDDEEEISDENGKIITVENKNIKPENNNPAFIETGTVWREHIVREGETLSDIAMAHGGITAQDILRANGLKDANKLSAKQLLLIPNDADKIDETLDEVRTRQMRVAAAKEKLEPIEIKSYVVAPGDSLWSIANSQGIEHDTLVGSNNFKTSARLRPGMVLRIPNQDGIFYNMKKNETLENVAKRFGLNTNKIKQVNVKKDFANLKTGDEIFLPGAKPEAEKTPAVAPIQNTAPKLANNNNNLNNNKSKKSQIIAYIEPSEKTSSAAYKWPLMGRINSPFGWRQHPITKRKDFHTGIDIKGERNAPIKAANYGHVIYSGWMGGYGKVLVIEHNNGQSTLYAHCSSLLAGKGATISQGQLIAKVGTTGRSTGPHLHFEVRNGNSPVNPIKYLSK